MPAAARALSLAAVVAGLAVSACASDPTWSSRGGRSGNAAIYEAVVRYVVPRYIPASSVDRHPAVACLAVGRRAFRTVREGRRSHEWDPSPELLQRVQGLVTMVVPASECAWNRYVEEEHRRSGQAAYLLALEHPVWITPDIVEVVTLTRQTSSYGGRYVCRLYWRGGQWDVEDCL